MMIGEVLKRLRMIYGYKATELIPMLDISQSYLSEIENSKKQPSLEILKKYSEVFEIKLSSLILLSESCEEAEKAGKGTVAIRKMMMSLIHNMSNTVGDSVETASKKI